MELIEVPLHAVAHSRAGDKGNRANLSLMPYDPALWPALAEQVTEERVLALFAHRGATRCTRYDLPLIHAFNFIIDDALDYLAGHPELLLPIAQLLARRVRNSTTYLVDLKRQFQDRADHLGMVDEVLESHVHQQDERFTPDADLPAEP